MPTLNIKDPEVYRLAALLAERRHKSMTAVVRQALAESETQDRPKSREGLAARLMEIGQLAKAEMDAAGVVPLTDDDLYDEWGLPK